MRRYDLREGKKSNDKKNSILIQFIVNGNWENMS